MVGNTKVIGITGGVGSGKSHVCKLITREFGYPVIDSDGISREQTDPGSPVLENVIKAFGTEYLNEDGTLNRGKLADTVFHEPEKLTLLNSLTHPPVINEINRLIAAYASEGIPFVFVESALACSAGYRAFCDELWLVSAPEPVRRYRLKKTRGYEDDKISSLFEGQAGEPELRKLCDREIPNGSMTGDTEICFLIKRYLSM